MTLPLEVAELVVDVEGVPIPQGSMIPIRRGAKVVLVPDNSTDLKRWRGDIVTRAKARMVVCGWSTLDGPIAVRVDFWLPRPAAAATRSRPHVRPDVDKLARAVLDALTIAEAFADDARVVELTARKHYAAQTCGARITISSIA